MQRRDAQLRQWLAYFPHTRQTWEAQEYDILIKRILNANSPLAVLEVSGWKGLLEFYNSEAVGRAGRIFEFSSEEGGSSELSDMSIWSARGSE